MFILRLVESFFKCLDRVTNKTPYTLHASRMESLVCGGASAASVAGKCLRVNSKTGKKRSPLFSRFTSQHVGLEKKTQQLCLTVPENTCLQIGEVILFQGTFKATAQEMACMLEGCVQR
jgi:hypothetical protein